MALRRFIVGTRGAVVVMSAVVLAAGAAAGPASSATATAPAGTAQIKGVNWDQAATNNVGDPYYPSGLSPSDCYADAYSASDQIVGQLYTITGANTVRLPINEATVLGPATSTAYCNGSASFWPAYQGAIDAALTHGSVILTYFPRPPAGKPDSLTTFDQMWDTVVAAYGANQNVSFEVVNEPHGLAAEPSPDPAPNPGTYLNDLYDHWLARYAAVSRGRVMLDGTGFADHVAAIGDDPDLAGTLLAMHDYGFWNASLQTESAWASQFQNALGGFAGRTVVTEWGSVPMSPRFEYNLNAPGSSQETAYLRGVSGELRSLGMGSVFWMGLRDGDGGSLTTKTVSGSTITLSLSDSSALARVRYAWGMATTPESVVKIRNSATGLELDGLGGTTAGSNAGQVAPDTSADQQWTVTDDGNGYVRVRNRATGLYLDGLGYTTDGAVASQWSDSNSLNQQWQLVPEAGGSNVQIRNRATGRFLDGLGSTASGSIVGQWTDSNNANQQWQVLMP